MPMYTLKQAFYTTPNNWQASELSQLKRLDLVGLCKVMGFRVSGSKAALVSRLIEHGQVYFFLAPWAKELNIDGLSKRLNLKTLRSMVKKLGLFVHSTKYGLAVSLIGWFRQCRMDGQKFLADTRAELATRPKQLELVFTYG